MILVMPMAGRGERFRKAGYTTPKPLIELSPDIPMFVKATESFPLRKMSEIVFVILREHCEDYGFDAEIRRRYADLPIRIVVLDAVTSGQAETVALALDRKRSDEGLIVFNGDSAFEDEISTWMDEEAPAWDAALQVFRDSDPRWSFAKVDGQGSVVETAEKKPISDLASTGLYYFKSWRQYLHYYDDLELTGGERYIAPLYNRYIADKRRVGILPCRRYLCFGTPLDYEACIKGRVYSF
jgi:UDP-N-acetylglucosamine diphosphorylase / glucose-1-phosphate thymidylyltransferase / UDP-N-acetylgalactosamine diphosphorylase / glucosamine-1-phosphate N-acetyltransferase / galactosamine-1-phosphate N-acetyltransferase